MALTLSHLSALDVIRTLRCEGHDLTKMDVLGLTKPSPWDGRRWNAKQFCPPQWQWGSPSANRPLDVLVPTRSNQIRMAHVRQHSIWQKLPPHSILWLDENSRVTSPELTFLQAATYLSLPMLVLLGYELCGHFSRTADEPLEGNVEINIPAATSTEEIAAYLNSFTRMSGLALAKEALSYVSNHALSAPEAVLATIYSLPVQEAGYGMGPVALNERIVVDGTDYERTAQSRYPDILFSFAPVGINYDGEDHLDLEGLVRTTRNAERADGNEKPGAEAVLREKLNAVRNKVVDDNTRNRQLMAEGWLVLPATKENLFGWGNLDTYTQELLACARHFCSVDTSEYERALDDTDNTRDRNQLLASMLPAGRPWGASHGRL